MVMVRALVPYRRGRSALLGALLAGVATGDLVTSSSSADAQDSRSARQRRAERVAREQPTPTRDRPKKEATAKPTVIPKMPSVTLPPEPLVAVISLPSQRIQVHSASGIVAESKVSSGKAGNATPTGVFSILQRNRYHESNIYSGAPMPFMQRLTWSGIALHQGVVPGYPASHGCIRLPGEFANRLWGLGRLGMRVIVTPGDTPASPITHARLPQPVMTPVAASLLPDAVKTAAATVTTSEGDHRLLDPFRLAHVRKVQSATDKVAAENAVKPAFDKAAETSAEAQRAADDLRKAERTVAELQAQVAEKSAAIARAQGSDADSPEGKALSAVKLGLEQAEKEFASGKAQEIAKSDAAFAAARAARDAEAAIETASTNVKTANAGIEPVTIFVSRKEGRVFVRQGFVSLLDEPITLKEPERPLGTHVFTAIDAADGGNSLKWLAVTVPNNPPDLDAPKKKPAKGQPPESPRVHLPASTASAVLDRIELPEATRKLVGDRLWPGASLIVSDYGISGETGRGTDFIVLTK